MIYVILAIWASLNLAVVFFYSLRKMAKEFWVEQKLFGKICINLFYSLAWVVNAIMTFGMIIIGGLLVAIYKTLKFILKFVSPLYTKALKMML